MYSNGRKISMRVLRRVWRFVTIRPQTPTREMARELGYASTSTVAPALRALRDAGYISFEDNTVGTRTILVPFIAVKKEHR